MARSSILIQIRTLLSTIHRQLRRRPPRIQHSSSAHRIRQPPQSELNDLDHELTQSTRWLNAFHTLSTLQVHYSSLIPDLQVLVNVMSQVTDCSGAVIALIGGDRPDVLVSAPCQVSGLEQAIAQALDPLAQTVAQHHQPFIQPIFQDSVSQPHTAVCIPLKLNQHDLGLLCLLYSEACASPEADFQWLSSLAHLLALTISQAQTEHQLQASEDRFLLASRALKGTIYDWDVQSGHVFRTNSMHHLLGFGADDIEPETEWWFSHVHPDDQKKVANLVDQDEFELEYRFRNSVGQYVTILDRGLVLRDDCGHPIRVVGYMLDVTQRKQELEERDRFFMLSADILCIIDLDGVFKRINPACERTLGFLPSEMIGQHYMNFVHPDDQAQTRQALNDMLQSMERGELERHIRCENRYRCKEGSYKWMQWSALIILNQNMIYAVGRDITEQKRSQAQIRDRDARLRSIFEQSSLGMAYAGIDGSYLEVNQQFCDFFGYTFDELKTITFRELIYPDDFEYSDQMLARLKSGEITSFTKEKRYVRKDGAIVWGKTAVSAIYNERGSLHYISIVLEDITERKQADVALAKSQQRYESLMQAIDGIVWEFDLSTQLFSFVNIKAEELLGYPVERWQTELQFWENHIHPDDRDWVVPYCWHATQACEDHHFEYRMIAADGRIVWLEDVVSVVVEQGKPIRLQGIMIDIGDRKRIEAEQQAAEQALAHQLQREQLLVEVTQHMRQSLDLNTILSTAVEDIRRTLHADRVLVFHIGENQVGQVIQESVREGYVSALNVAWPNECFPADCHAFYLQGQPRIVADVTTDTWGECLVEYARAMGVKSKVVAPILQPVEDDQPRIWGLLVLHACAEQRQWQTVEADLLQHIADQLAIAIQQSELYHRLQHANQELEYLATHDKLTKIANRRSFEDICQREWNRLTREQQPLTLIMADLDFFKQYNDTYGHQMGDECLLGVAQAIQFALKRPGDLVARYGGEEFIVILPSTDVIGAIAVVREIQDSVRSLAIPHLESKVSDYITLSLGIATITPHPTITIDHLLAAADASLYKAKERGRNGFAIASAASIRKSSRQALASLHQLNKGAQSNPR